jgi:hypothetical protein
MLVYSSSRIVKGIEFSLPGFPRFTSSDFDRLKDNKKWLSDSHVQFALR